MNRQYSIDDGFLYLKGRGADARGKFVKDGFLVLKGSKAAPDENRVCAPSVHAEREKLTAEGTLAGSVLTRDLLFSGLSRACAVMTGGIADGRNYWKYVTGEAYGKRETREYYEDTEAKKKLSATADDPVNVGCPSLERVIHIMRTRVGEADIMPLVCELKLALKRDFQVIVPLNSAGADGVIEPLALTYPAKPGNWLAVCTNKTEVEKGPVRSWKVIPMRELLDVVRKDRFYTGIVLNPFGKEQMPLNRRLIGMLKTASARAYARILTGDAFDLPVDAVVSMGGMETHDKTDRIRTEGGIEVYREYMNYGGVDCGEVCLTGSGSLPAYHVIHAGFPDAENTPDYDAYLYCVFHGILTLAIDFELHSIAIPLPSEADPAYCRQYINCFSLALNHSTKKKKRYPLVIYFCGSNDTSVQSFKNAIN